MFHQAGDDRIVVDVADGGVPMPPISNDAVKVLALPNSPRAASEGVDLLGREGCASCSSKEAGMGMAMDAGRALPRRNVTI